METKWTVRSVNSTFRFFLGRCRVYERNDVQFAYFDLTIEYLKTGGNKNL